MKARRLFRLLTQRTDPAADVDSELELHIQLRAEEFEREGLAPPDARARAVACFGDVSETRATLVRSATAVVGRRRHHEWISDLGRDLRLAVRSLRRAPLIAGGAIVAFMLGIGATTVMYSIGHAVLAELPVPDADRLVQLINVDRNRGVADGSLRLAELIAIRSRQTTLVGVGAWTDQGLHFGDGKSAAERVSGARITAGLFGVLGVRTALGREFIPADEVPGAAQVVLLSNRLWRDRFDADSSVVGTVVRVNGRPAAVVGVMPPDFEFPSSNQAWIPLAVAPALVVPDTAPGYVGIGRLRDGVSLAEAEGELANIGAGVVRARRSNGDRETLTARPFADWMVGPAARVRLYAMMLVVSSVLVIACANVANLLLTRTLARIRELAVRLALGSSRFQVVRSLVIEAFLLAAVGGVLGTAFATVGVGVFRGAVDFELPYWSKIEVDWPVLSFVFGLVLLSAVVTGLGSGRRAANLDPGEVLRSEARGAAGVRLGRINRELLIVQVALATVLLTITGLMVKGAVVRLGRSPVAAPEQIATARIELTVERFPTVEDQARVVAALAERLRRYPGVASVAAGTTVPGYIGPTNRFTTAGMTPDAADAPEAAVSAISTGYFATYGIPLVAGREFGPADRVGSTRVALISRSLAERYFAGQLPIGARIRIAGPAAGFEPGTVPVEEVEIVGVVENIFEVEASTTNNVAVYLPFDQVGDQRIAIGVRGSSDPIGLTAAIRDAVFAVDPDVPVFRVDRLTAVYARSIAGERVFAGLFAGFGASGLLLAAVGLFAIVAFGVRQRAGEIAVRLALGESRPSVVSRLARAGLGRLSVGLILGLGLAYLVSPTLGGEVLFGTAPRDLAVFAAVGASVATVTATAVVIPAWLSLRIDPATVLRGQ